MPYPYNYSDIARGIAAEALRSVGFVGSDAFASFYDCCDIVRAVNEVEGARGLSNPAGLVRRIVESAHAARVRRDWSILQELAAGEAAGPQLRPVAVPKPAAGRPGAAITAIGGRW